MPIAVLRPDQWELPLFLHVLGAMTLVGSLLFVVSILLLAWRRSDEDAATLTRFAFRALLLAVLPSFIVMRVAAEWIASKEYPEGSEEPGWIGIGYATTEPGAVLLLIALILAGIGLRRGYRRLPARIVAVLTTVLLAAYLVAMWAMTAKPS